MKRLFKSIVLEISLGVIGVMCDFADIGTDIVVCNGVQQDNALTPYQIPYVCLAVIGCGISLCVVAFKVRVRLLVGMYVCLHHALMHRTQLKFLRLQRNVRLTP